MSNMINKANPSDIHRNAYNAAFYELGLRWHWDDTIYENLLCEADEHQRLRAYLETHQPHLLRAYDADFLIGAIEATKARCYNVMTAEGCHSGGYIDWAELQQVQIGS
ncbi:MAG: hypothetical protein ACI83P_001443 [Janthinobacterium sp.]|jgi:hypothetical protein